MLMVKLVNMLVEERSVEESVREIKVDIIADHKEYHLLQVREKRRKTFQVIPVAYTENFYGKPDD